MGLRPISCTASCDLSSFPGMIVRKCDTLAIPWLFLRLLLRWSMVFRYSVPAIPASFPQMLCNVASLSGFMLAMSPLSDASKAGLFSSPHSVLRLLTNGLHHSRWDNPSPVYGSLKKAARSRSLFLTQSGWRLCCTTLVWRPPKTCFKRWLCCLCAPPRRLLALPLLTFTRFQPCQSNPGLPDPALRCQPRVTPHLTRGRVPSPYPLLQVVSGDVVYLLPAGGPEAVWTLYLLGFTC